MSDPRIVLLSPSRPQILDLAGPLGVFWAANDHVPGASYRLDVVSAAGGPVRSTCGLELVSSSIGSVRGPVDTLLVAGGDVTETMNDEDVLRHVRRLAGSARRVASVCTGAFVLAAAGLLDGRRATTHWAWCDELGEGWPDTTVDPDAIYVRDGEVWTSAGVTSGIDLALALVAEDHGQRAAATVARHLVVYLRRSGGQAQFSAPLAAQAAEREPLRELLAWLVEHLDDDLSVAALARRMNLSERQFTRVFKSEVGVTPADHVETVRLEAACRLLETTSAAVEQIARDCGFGTPETMHRAFRRRRSTTPGQHRRHFRATA